MEISSTDLSNCPYCDSQHIQGEEIDLEAQCRTVNCLDCERHWQEWFVWTTVYIPQEHEEVYKAAHTQIPEVEYRPRVFNPQPKPEKRGKK